MLIISGRTWNQGASLFVIAMRFELERCITYREADSHRCRNGTIAKIGCINASSSTRSQMVNRPNICHSFLPHSCQTSKGQNNHYSFEKKRKEMKKKKKNTTKSHTINILTLGISIPTYR